MIAWRINWRKLSERHSPEYRSSILQLLEVTARCASAIIILQVSELNDELSRISETAHQVPRWRTNLSSSNNIICQRL